jgi:NTE family protein
MHDELESFMAERTKAMAFAGGLGLASYHGGVIQAYLDERLYPDWVTGSSAGAVTAAILAGSPPGEVVSRLKSFWNISAGMMPAAAAPWTYLRGWQNVLRSHLFGSWGHFHPRLPSSFRYLSLYDLAPMRQRLGELIDFDRLNGSAMRLSVAATDLATGDPIVFDTRTSRIGIDHLLASCGFLPEFAPVEIDGRMFVDGGLSINAPFDPVLREVDPVDLFVIDLFARDGAYPTSFERGAERKTDLMLGNQTFLRLQLLMELRSLKHASAVPDRVTYLSYSAGPEEPGPEKSFNFSRAGLSGRWREGWLDMTYALAQREAQCAELTVVRRPPSE